MPTNTEVPLDQLAAGSEHSTFLFFTGNGSDKVYQVHLRAKGDAFVVDYGNGPRGGTLTTGTRTQAPLAWDAAFKIYAKVIKEKTGKGYTREQSGAIYTASEVAGRSSGLQPQLPTAISHERSEELIEDPAWGLQQKADGENRILVVEGHEVKGVNRRGLFVDIPVGWKSPPSEGWTVFCGEHVGERFQAFDLLGFMGKDLRALPYDERHHRLSQLVAACHTTLHWIDVLELAYTAERKRELAETIRRTQGEGWCFKRLDAPFASGRSDDSVKVRLWEGATCLVTRVNAKRSVGVALFDADGALVDLGNVTIPANEPIPAVDALIEVRYLYRHHEGKFEMPTFQRVRTDLVREDATLSQITRIKKRGSADDADDLGAEALEEADAVERPRG